MNNPPFNTLMLIVEDDVMQRMLASVMFSEAGYRVLAAENADEALLLLEANAGISLLFTDVSLPGSMSGAHLAQRVGEQWPEIAIIIVSGRPRPEKLPWRMHFYPKPYEPAVILQQAGDLTARLQLQ